MLEFDLSYAIGSLIAGILTVLAPCILPLLPVIIGSSTDGGTQKRKPFVIIASLLVSVIVFSLLLHGSTVLLGVPDSVWRWISGGILLIFGIVTLFPDLWERVMEKAKLNQTSNSWLSRAMSKEGYTGQILVGAALGPVFTSCSPTYIAVVGFIIPSSYAIGMFYLTLYVVGLAIPLLGIALLGQRFTRTVRSLSNPNGWFKRMIAIIFIVVGISIIFGYDKDFQEWLIDRGVYDFVKNIENIFTQ